MLSGWNTVRLRGPGWFSLLMGNKVVEEQHINIERNNEKCFQNPVLYSPTAVMVLQTTPHVGGGPSVFCFFGVFPKALF